MRGLRAAVGGAVLIAGVAALISPLASRGASSSARSLHVRRGDVVLFSVPRLATLKCGASGRFVQRVAGMPGDVWSEVRGHVFINGRQLQEPYLRATARDRRTLALSDIPPRGRYARIPSGMYLLMGDNRTSACDSRVWGLIPRAAIHRVLKRA
jgi:signal peptidase I